MQFDFLLLMAAIKRYGECF